MMVLARVASMIFLAYFGASGREYPTPSVAPHLIDMGQENQGPPTFPCWIFLHMQKAGGTTVNTILKHKWHHEVGTDVYDTRDWKKGDAQTQKYVQEFVAGHTWKVVRGATAEAMRRFDHADRCKWFTVFRHPISRLVSAYFWCKRRPVDKLCASEIMSARDTDLLGFARHWGNYGVRQFAFAFVAADDVLAAFSNGTLSFPHDVPWTSVSDWYLLKVYFDYLSPPTPDRPTDAALYDMLGRIQDTIRDQYTVVGILENWNTTLNMLNAGLGMPGLDWQKAYRSMGTVNTNEDYEEGEKNAALEMAWTSAELKSFIRLDLLLYEHAKDVFNQQARMYNILQ